jgi:hypothetical protein
LIEADLQQRKQLDILFCASLTLLRLSNYRRGVKAIAHPQHEPLPTASFVLEDFFFSVTICA